jgi:hypothetical protein
VAAAKAVIASSALLYREQMKRKQQKLAVRRDTIRQLAASDLVPVHGGDASGAICTAVAPPQLPAAPKP